MNGESVARRQTRRKSKFSEEQIIAILAEQERGMATAEVCRCHGVSSATFYKWKAKFGGMDISDARGSGQLPSTAPLEPTKRRWGDSLLGGLTFHSSKPTCFSSEARENIIIVTTSYAPC
nr:transposase [uncultured Hyphomonas sp.]